MHRGKKAPVQRSAVSCDGPVAVHPRQIALAFPEPQAPPPAPELAAGPAELVHADQSPVRVYLARLADGSRRHMASSLVTIGRVLTGRKLPPERIQWHLLRYQHAQAARSALAGLHAPATCNRHLAALRGVLKECWRLGLMDAAAYAQAVDVEGVRGQQLPAGREVTVGELRALFDACAALSGPAGARDAALVAVLYGCGLRRAEAADLQLDDYDPKTGELKVTGKGRRQRLVYVVAGGRAAIGAWLEHRGLEQGPLFHPIRKGGQILRRRMDAHSIFYRLRSIARRARVAKCSPHDLRRSFVSHLLDHGADIIAVRDLAGHASVNTTARYDRRGERGKKAASELLEVPFAKTPPAPGAGR